MTPPREISREERLWSTYNQGIINRTGARIFPFTDDNLPQGCNFKRFNYGEGLMQGSRELAAHDGVAYIDASVTSLEKMVQLGALIDVIRQLGYGEINGFFRYLTSTRGDRPADDRLPVRESIPVIQLGCNLLGFNRVFITEPHSGVITAFLSRELNIPTVGLSPNQLVVDQFKTDYQGNRKSLVVVGPDNGRGSTASKIADQLNTRVVSLDKTRDPATGVVKISELTPENIERLEGRDVVIYDDVIATGGTLREIVEKLAKAGVNGVYILSCHAVFSGKAVERLSHPLIKKIYITDSRKPEGNLSQLGDRLITVPLQPFVDRIIQADMRSPFFNPWREIPQHVTEPIRELPQPLRETGTMIRRRIMGLSLNPNR